MEVTIQKVSPFGRRIKLDIPSADLQSEIDQKLRSLAKTTFVPGFRKGKVPKAILQRQYGGNLHTEAMTSLVQRRLYPILEENEIAPAIEPFIIDYSPDGRECFLYLEVGPESVVTDLLGQKTVRPKVRLTPEVIDKEMDELKLHYRKWESVERPAEKGDRIQAKVKLSELTGDKSFPVDDSGEQTIPIILSKQRILDEVVDACIGQSVGSIVTVKTANSKLHKSGEPEQLNEDLPKQTFEFQINIDRIEKPLRGQFDQQLYDRLNVESVHDEDFREKVCSLTKRKILERIYRSLVGQVRYLLMNLNEFEPSNYLVVYGMINALHQNEYDRTQIEMMFIEEHYSEHIKDFRFQIAADVKWTIIEHNLIQRISPEQKDLLEIPLYGSIWAIPRMEADFSGADESATIGYDSSVGSLVNFVLSESECQEIDMSVREFKLWEQEYHPEVQGHHDHVHGHEHHHHHHHHHHHEHHEHHHHHEGEHSEHKEHEIVQDTSVSSSSAEVESELELDDFQRRLNKIQRGIEEIKMRTVIYSRLGVTLGSAPD